MSPAKKALIALNLVNVGIALLLMSKGTGLWLAYLGGLIVGTLAATFHRGSVTNE